MGVQEVWQLVVVRLLHGSAGGMIIPIAKAYIGELSPKGEEGTWMGYYNTAFFAGMGCGPLIGGVLYDAFSGAPLIFNLLDPGMVAAFGAMGLLNLIGAASVFFFLPEMAAGPDRQKPKPSFRRMSGSGPFRGLLSLRLVEGLGRTSFFAFIPIFAGIQLGLSTTHVGTLLTVHVLLSALMQAPMGKITDRFQDRISRRSLIIGGGAMIVVYMALAPLATQFWHLLLVSITAGLVSSMTTPAGSAIAVGEGRKFGMASVMATVSLAISAGMALGPLLGGTVVELANRGVAAGASEDVRAVFYVAAVFVFVGVSLFAWFTRPQTVAPTPVESFPDSA
jgi:MFS family permease